MNDEREQEQCPHSSESVKFRAGTVIKTTLLVCAFLNLCSQLPISGVACQVQSGPDPGLLGAQARDSVCLLEIKHAAFSFTKREPVQNH